ncbi:hypothetical protein bcgnr5382_56830 [Bacillus cereus]
MVNCPKCDADITGTYEGAEPDVGIMCGGYYCDACDLGVGEHEVEREPLPGDVPISFALDAGAPLGTEFSELASQPGTTPEQNAKYENFKRIARSWGYD